MSHHKHTPEQMKRINAFLKKASKENRLPESYFAHLIYEVNMLGYEGFAHIQAEFASINPALALRYLITRKTPKPEPSKHMRKSASCALLEASTFGDVKLAEGLIHDLKADVNYMDEKGTTPLYRAIRRKRLGMAEMLLKHGAKNIAGKDHLDPLSLACGMDFSLAIPLFMKYGVDVNAPRPFKSWNKFHLGYRTFYAYPLAVAVSQNSPDATQTLLDNGADMDLKIRPDLTIREFMDAHVENMPPKMQQVIKGALAGEKTDVQVNLPPQKVATKSQPTLISDTARTHD